MAQDDTTGQHWPRCIVARGDQTQLIDGLYSAVWLNKPAPFVHHWWYGPVEAHAFGITNFPWHHDNVPLLHARALPWIQGTWAVVCNNPATPHTPLLVLIRRVAYDDQAGYPDWLHNPRLSRLKHWPQARTYLWSHYIRLACCLCKAICHQIHVASQKLCKYRYLQALILPTDFYCQTNTEP